MAKVPVPHRPTSSPDDDIVPAAGRMVSRTDNLDPVTDAVETFNQAVRESHDGRLVPRKDELLARVDKVQVTNEDENGRAADFIRQLQAVAVGIENCRTETKQPYLDAGRAIDDAAKAHSIPVSDAIKSVTELTREYGRAKLRKQREREEAKRAAAAKDEERPQYYAPVEPRKRKVTARGDYGAVSTTAPVAVGVVVDYAKAFKAVKDNEGVKAAIDKAIAARVRSGDRKIPGVDIKEDVATRVR